ncbi:MULTISPECIES: TRAP transporter small permease [unclassified Salinicola]|uniref:TRAP transporter small permease n=1 Tax=unclassified Salinicola TaxID=2634022 RepID=UPI001A8ED788|nr:MULTISPECIES: TRAP transporter small permease [unclassified Salinicola]MCE3027481.1 TRAP transporter small permease [Salinicola sp. DM10]WIX34185.1 TRAP transporter small permease [Salinicola sp. JS01]
MLLRIWNSLEEGLVALLLAVMTLLTFFYVVVTNLYNVFYDLGDAYPALETPAFAVGDWLLGIGQEMTWSLAMTTTIFAWLIFLGIAYGVRVGAHIGVDLLVRLLPRPWQRVCGVLSCLIFMAYAGLLMVSSAQWVDSLQITGIGAEDLGMFGLKEWHVALIEPLGFGLIIARLIEVLVRILRGQQLGLEQSSEVSDALALAQESDADSDTRRTTP